MNVEGKRHRRVAELPDVVHRHQPAGHADFHHAIAEGAGTRCSCGSLRLRGWPRRCVGLDLRGFSLERPDTSWDDGSAGPEAAGLPVSPIGQDALQRVVAATYRTTPKRPVQAVRAALEESGLLGARVTIDPARKAVAAARARGFIPPAKQGRQLGGES